MPPDILYEETSPDISVSEGVNTSLICRASGHPPPRITWRREDGEYIMQRKNLREITKGKVLIISSYFDDRIIKKVLNLSS